MHFPTIYDLLAFIALCVVLGVFLLIGFLLILTGFNNVTDLKIILKKGGLLSVLNLIKNRLKNFFYVILILVGIILAGALLFFGFELVIDHPLVFIALALILIAIKL